MKQDMVTYTNFLTGDDSSILEELISYKFKKFRHFYRLLSDNSDLIDYLHYKFSDNDTLKVTLTTNGDVKSLVKLLREKSMTQNNYECNITYKKEEIYVTITLTE